MIEHKFNNKHAKYIAASFKETEILPLALHNTKVMVIKSYEDAIKIKPRLVEADAIVTNVQGIKCFITGADCPSIVFKDNINNIAAISHCGWKPALNGILQNTISELKNLNADIKNLEVFIGPGMQQKSFECQADLYNKFIEQSKDNEKFFTTKSETHFLFDLVGYCKNILENNGICNVSDSAIDTFSDENYHSYREYTHKYGKDFHQEFEKNKDKYVNFNYVEIL